MIDAVRGADEAQVLIHVNGFSDLAYVGYSSRVGTCDTHDRVVILEPGAETFRPAGEFDAFHSAEGNSAVVR